MRKATKAEFKELYFRHGHERDGWGQAYWDKFFEKEEVPPMTYSIEEPPSPEHTRMMIVNDRAIREHRLFFMTDEAEERFFSR